MANEVNTLNGLFKDRYADKVKLLVPDHVKLYNAVKFDTSKKVGGSYKEPVILSLESGFTYGEGASGTIFSLNDVKQFKMEEASIKARELVLRSAITIGALSRSASDAQAIEKAMDLMVGNMLKSIYHRLEVQMFYGQSGIGVIGDQNDDGDEADTFPAAAVPSLEIKLKESEWAAGIWNGTTGAEVEIFSADLLSKRGVYTIEGYSLANRSITVSRTDNNNIAINELKESDVVYFKGAAINGALPKKNEFLGVHGIAKETESLFSITNTSEPLFQGSTVDVGTEASPAILSFAKIEEGVAAMVEKGLMEEQVSCYVNPKQWNSLLTEIAAKRSYDQSYSPAKQENGSKEIVFHGQNGTIKIIASTFVKEGYAYILCEKDLKRIGSEEVTFKRPDGEQYLELLEGYHAMEMRCYTDQALFTARPASICVLQNIKVGPFTP